jgi:hypothetical protein
LNQLRFEFAASECQGWPWLRALVDHQPLQNYHLQGHSHTVVLDLDVSAGQHILQFERFGKTDDNTRVDGAGNILQDQTVELQNIYFEDIRLPIQYLWQGTFIYGQITQKSSLRWGPNGIWSWAFETPVLPWLINIKNQQRHDAKELFVPTADRVKEFKQKISKITNDLQHL